jgi:hypothetical protein
LAVGCGVQSDLILTLPERLEAYFNSKKHRKPLCASCSNPPLLNT